MCTAYRQHANTAPWMMARCARTQSTAAGRRRQPAALHGEEHLFFPLAAAATGKGRGSEEPYDPATCTHQQRARFPACRARRRARAWAWRHGGAGNKRGVGERRTNSVGRPARPAGGVWWCGVDRLGGSEVCGPDADWANHLRLCCWFPWSRPPNSGSL